MILSWQRKESRFTDGGKLNYIHFSILALVAFFNASAYYIETRNILEMGIHVAPFIFMIALLFFLRSDNTNAIIFLFIAIGTTIDPANISDYSGAVFFIFAFHIIRRQWFAYCIMFLSVSCLTIRSIIANDTIPGTLIMIAVFFYIYAIYYFLIFKASWKKQSPLTKEQMNIMKMVAVDGMSQKMIAAELGISQDKVFTEIKEIRELLTKEGDQTITKDQVIYIITKEYGFSDGK